MAQPSLTRMSPRARLACRVFGIALTAAGAVCFGTAVFTMAGDEFDVFQRVTLFAFSGIALLAVGGNLLRLGFLRTAAELVATETAPAVEHLGAAAGRGWSSGTGGTGGAGGGVVQVVRIKCRSCGFLESEEARFCSGCGKAV